MKIILFILILLLENSIYSQTYEGKIIDDNQIVISYANISFNDSQNNYFGWTTNENGTFSIESSILKNVDSIHISRIGFYTKTLSIKDLKTNEYSEIHLMKKEYNIAEVVVNDNKVKTKVKTIGNHKNKSNAGDFFPYLKEIALFIPNKEQKEGIINNINVKLTNKINTVLPVRVHVYSVKKLNEGPKNELLKEMVLATTKNNNGRWISADISNQRIVFPKEGVFIGFEFLPPNDLNITEKNRQCIKLVTDKSEPLRVQRGFVKKKEECYTWERYFRDKKTKKNFFKGGKWYYIGDNKSFPGIEYTTVIMSADIFFKN